MVFSQVCHMQYVFRIYIVCNCNAFSGWQPFRAEPRHDQILRWEVARFYPPKEPWQNEQHLWEQPKVLFGQKNIRIIRKKKSKHFLHVLPVHEELRFKKWCKKRYYIDLKHIAFLDPPKPLKMRACGQLFSHGSEWSPISKGSLNGVLISLISETVSAGHQTHHVRWFCLTLQRMRQNIYSFEGLSETKRLKNFYNTMNSTLRWQSQIVQWVSRLFMVSPSLN